MLSWCCEYECYETDKEYICKSCGARKQKTMSLEETLCPDCNSKMIARNGKFGKFWGCSNYPVCKGTRDSQGRSKAEREAWKEEQETKPKPEPKRWEVK